MVRLLTVESRSNIGISSLSASLASASNILPCWCLAIGVILPMNLPVSFCEADGYRGGSFFWSLLLANFASCCLLRLRDPRFCKTSCSDVTECFEVCHFWWNRLLFRTWLVTLSSLSKMLSMSFFIFIWYWESTEALACRPLKREAWLPCRLCMLFNQIGYSFCWSFSSSAFARTPGKGVRLANV